MRKVLTAAEMREVDKLTTERSGIPSIGLMENAARAVTDVVSEVLGVSVQGKSVLVLCGKGNNGGDGAAIARQLFQLGADVSVCLFGKVEETKGDARKNFEIVEKLSRATAAGGDARLILVEVETSKQWDEFPGRGEGERPELMVDAIFGTGLTKPLAGVHE
ncbi:MAG TPA: NAD(P)H-hydrate epimerase, partial [Pyrinomonadaceae bacterium]|nr:NAD(P)H-hydrate epimerase [Pyrinomonadaceae bacterium]